MLLAATLVTTAPARVVAIDRCAKAFDHPEVVTALANIRASIDPCGDSPELAHLLDAFQRCAQDGYAICINREAERNSTDRTGDESGARVFITWNPELHTDLEMGCGSNPARAVPRDPTASLLHEIAHVVQDCTGLDPNAHELEAVRIENIYRRARQLCQRTAYGAQRLPVSMVVECEPGRCLCTPRGGVLMAGGGQPGSPPRPVAAAGDGTVPSP